MAIALRINYMYMHICICIYMLEITDDCGPNYIYLYIFICYINISEYFQSSKIKQNVVRKLYVTGHQKKV